MEVKIMENEVKIMENEKLLSIKLMSELSGVTVNIKEVVDDWVLLTYDLPNTEEGNKLRTEFLKKAARLGFVQHTESVYLAPLCPETELLAIELSEKGKLYIWTSSIKDEKMAKEITDKYDDRVSKLFDEIKGRIDKMKKYANAGDLRNLSRMRKKTEELLRNADGVANRRRSIELANKVAKLNAEYQSIEVQRGNSSPS
jgi:hypothetical protein